MLYRKQGLPEVEDIVLCKVSKLYPNTVFVDLLEYPGKTGMIYISEIAPGRIRNLREYVELDRQIVCKVLKVDPHSGNIDLSLRRVNSAQRSAKLEEIKQELKAETLVKSIAEKTKRPLEEVYAMVSQQVFKEYSHLYLCFREIAEDAANLEKLGVENSLAHELTAVILEKFKPPKVTISGEIRLTTYASDGIEKIKIIFAEITKAVPSLSTFYLGGGRYKFGIEDVDYKAAEKKLHKAEELLAKFNDKLSTATLEREKKE